MAKKQAVEKVAEEVAPPTENTPAVRAENAIVPQAEQLSAWGKSQVSAKDIIIPRIMLMQPMSEAVTAGDAAFGDYRESLSNEKLGDSKETFEIVPFHMEKIFVEYDVTKGEGFKDKKFLRVRPITPENENLPYKDEEKDDAGQNVKVSRDKCMNFYCLLVKELEFGGAIPYVITARRSSIKAGKKLATQMFVKNAAAGKTPAAIAIQVLSEKETNDAGTFAIMDVKPSRPAKSEWIVEAFKWLGLVQQGRAKVDEESYVQDEAGGTATAAPAADGPGRF